MLKSLGAVYIYIYQSIAQSLKQTIQQENYLAENCQVFCRVFGGVTYD